LFIEHAGSGVRDFCIRIDSEGKIMNNNSPSEIPFEKNSIQNGISTDSPIVLLQKEINKTKIQTLSSITALGLLLFLVLTLPIQPFLTNPAVIVFFVIILCLFFAVDKITKRISKYLSHVYYQICMLMIVLPLIAYSLSWEWVSIGIAIWIIMTMLFGSFEYYIFNQKLKDIE
jgi:hypothetical protein